MSTNQETIPRNLSWVAGCCYRIFKVWRFKIILTFICEFLENWNEQFSSCYVFINVWSLIMTFKICIWFIYTKGFSFYPWFCVLYFRNILNLPNADSTEINPDSENPVVIDMPEYNPGVKGGTMRLGKRQTIFTETNSILSKCHTSKSTNVNIVFWGGGLQ